MPSSSNPRSRLPAGLRSFRPVLDRLVFALALLGVLLAVHLWIQQGRGFDRGCFGFSQPDPSVTIGCEVVTASTASAARVPTVRPNALADSRVQRRAFADFSSAVIVSAVHPEGYKFSGER